MEPFVNLLNRLHRWCCSDDALPETPDNWFSVCGLDPPGNLDEWLRLGRTPVGEWGLATLPPDWDPAWRILSRQERTLTVEALDYLDRHAPGAIAAALPRLPVVPLSQPDSPSLPDMREDWSLDEMIRCVEREIQRREQAFSLDAREAHLTSHDAAQELGQMRAVLHNLKAQRPDDPSPQTEMRTPLAADETPRQEPLF